MRKFKVGTRKSRLAMIQTEGVIKELQENNPGLEFEIVPFSTLGDRIQDKALTEFGGKGAFITELEDAILRGDIDLAVHSAKDLPLTFPKGLGILGVSKREDPRDVLVTRKGEVLESNGVIGTGSPRRKLQLAMKYPYTVKELRGNVNTRLKKLAEGEYDGLLLAAAGLKRLQADRLPEYDFRYFDTNEFIPAAGQGIIAVEGRLESKTIPDGDGTPSAACEDGDLYRLMERWSDKEAFAAFETEREVLRILQADCTAPLGVYASTEGEKININALYGYGGRTVRVLREGLLKDRFKLAGETGEALLNGRGCQNGSEKE